MIQLENTSYLIPGLTALAVILIASVLLRFKKGSGSRISLLSSLLRSITLALLFLALCSPFTEEKITGSKALVLVDVSDSNDEAVSQTLLERLDSFRSAGIEPEIMVFGHNAGEFLPDSSQSFRQLKQEGLRLDIGSTSLQNAFEKAALHEPSSLVLISDGFETAGNARPIVQNLAGLGFKIFPLVPENASATAENFKISNLHAPLTAPNGKSVEVRVSIDNSTGRAQRGQLEVKHDGKTILSRNAEVPPGQELLLTALSDPSKEGIKEITATLKPDSSSFSTSSETIYLSGETREKVLLMNGTPEDGRVLRSVLEGQSYQLNSVTAGIDSAATGDLKDYSVVILNNISLNQLPRGFSSTLESYVQGGGSFIMLGGNKSFGLGGYINSTIEDILPVNLVPPQTTEKRLNVAVQLVIDKSRSMASDSKLEYAKEAAIDVVNNLKNEDFVGVMGFDENPFVVIRMGNVAAVKGEAVKRIGLLFPNRGTSLVGALDEARRDLVRVNAGRKHMIVLTDGQITDAPGHYYYELVKQIRLLGITVSTVMLGNERNISMLKEMANLGGGAFYQTGDARSLPRIFLQDVKVASGERTMKEETDYAVRPGTGELKSTEIRSFPNLRGYVQTKIKPRANLELVTYAANKAEPLLASWKYGQGKSTAFTSDANGRWSNQWVAWPRFQKFWSDVIDSMRKETGEEKDKIRFDLRRFYENGALNFDLTLFSGFDSGKVSAELIVPGGSKSVLEFDPVTKGRFRASVSQPKAGKYEFYGTVAGAKLTPVAFHLSGELFGEKKGQGFNLPYLQYLAGATSGKVNPAPEEVKNQIYTRILKNDLTFSFVLAALIVFMLEIAMREIVIVFFQRKFRLGKPSLSRKAAL